MPSGMQSPRRRTAGRERAGPATVSDAYRAAGSAMIAAQVISRRLVASAALILASPLLAAAATSPRPAVPSGTTSVQDAPSSTANFGGEAASIDARTLANWVVASHDNHAMPFVIVDKINAKVFLFDPQGGIKGATAALLGLSRRDDSVPGIGQRRLVTITPAERTTPAGRFQASLGRDFEQDILWIDYDSALSLHRVIVGSPKDHRAQRLASASVLDNRISYGCINVPAAFYDDVVKPAFTATVGIVYILPETRPLRAVFAMPAPSIPTGTVSAATR